MKATELKSESLKKEYSVVIPAADFEKEVDAKIDRIAKTNQISGFPSGQGSERNAEAEIPRFGFGRSFG